MMYYTTGQCGANIDVTESHGTTFAQCSRGREMQSGSDERFYPEEMCQYCDLASSLQYPSHCLDDYDDDNCDYDDDDGDITCFE